MKYILTLLLFVAGFGCSTIKINYDYDRQADLTKYKTYQLSEESQNLPVQQLNRDRILAAIEEQMTLKGFSKSDNPDFIVDVHVVGKQVQTATATTSGYATAGYRGYRGYGYGSGFSTTQVSYDEYTEGTMLITFIDPSVKKIVWQGSGTKTLLENASTEKREKNINYAVEQILNNYPLKK